MRIVLIFTTLFFVAALTFAQNPLGKGEMQLNGGLGLGSFGTPIYIGLEYGIYYDLSLAADLSYQSKNYGYAKQSAIGASLKGNYHFNRLLNIDNKWDFYAGLGLNYYNFNTKFSNSNTNYLFDYNSKVGVDAQAGGRYFFTDNLGINLEYGEGSNLSGGRLGLTYKFKKK
jgi:hypothetical protein